MTPEHLEALRARATRPRRTVPLVLDGDLREQIEALGAELDRIEEDAAAPADRRLGHRPSHVQRIAEIQAALDALHDRAEECTVQVVVEGVAGTPWRALFAEHPPREDHAGDKRFGANMDAIREPAVRAGIIGYRSGDDIVPFSAGYLDWLLSFTTDRQNDNLLAAVLETSRGDDAVPLRRTPSATRTSAEG